MFMLLHSPSHCYLHCNPSCLPKVLARSKSRIQSEFSIFTAPKLSKVSPPRHSPLAKMAAQHENHIFSIWFTLRERKFHITHIFPEAFSSARNVAEAPKKSELDCLRLALSPSATAGKRQVERLLIPPIKAALARSAREKLRVDEEVKLFSGWVRGIAFLFA